MDSQQEEVQPTQPQSPPRPQLQPHQVYYYGTPARIKHKRAITTTASATAAKGKSTLSSDFAAAQLARLEKEMSRTATKVTPSGYGASGNLHNKAVFCPGNGSNSMWVKTIASQDSVTETEEDEFTKFHRSFSEMTGAFDFVKCKSNRGSSRRKSQTKAKPNSTNDIGGADFELDEADTARRRSITDSADSLHSDGRKPAALLDLSLDFSNHSNISDHSDTSTVAEAKRMMDSHRMNQVKSTKNDSAIAADVGINADAIQPKRREGKPTLPEDTNLIRPPIPMKKISKRFYIKTNSPSIQLTSSSKSKASQTSSSSSKRIPDIMVGVPFNDYSSNNANASDNSNANASEESLTKAEPNAKNATNTRSQPKVLPGEHIVTCNNTGCSQNLIVKKSAILVRCQLCSKVSPASSSASSSTTSITTATTTANCRLFEV